MSLIGGGYGVLSAFREGRPDADNEYAHGQLLGDLNAMGYQASEAVGEWEGVPERCWVVPGIKPEILLELGTKYRQEAVVYCPDGEDPRVVGMDWLEELGKGRGGIRRPPLS